MSRRQLPADRSDIRIPTCGERIDTLHAAPNAVLGKNFPMLPGKPKVFGFNRVHPGNRKPLWRR
jgi:hypothetical protein